MNMEKMKKYRIEKRVLPHRSNPALDVVLYIVQVRNVLGVWTNVKVFQDLWDEDFALREAEELLEILEKD